MTAWLLNGRGGGTWGCKYSVRGRHGDRYFEVWEGVASPRVTLCLTKHNKKIVEESKLQGCSEEERDLFMYNMRAREALQITLPENEYS